MRKYVFLFPLLCLLIIPGAASSQRLTIVIKNIRDDQGKVGAALYNKEADFLKKYLDTRSVKATRGEVRLVFDNLPAGDYAISVLHDFNDNGDMDTDFLGIPKEGFGFSNDAMGTFGPPKFEKARISFSGKNQTIIITMKYI